MRVRRPGGQVYDAPRRLADELGGHYLDQFTNAERATDWRGNNNIAESIFDSWPRNRTRCRSGSSSARAPAARAPRSAGTCVPRPRHAAGVVDPEGSAFLPALRG